MASRHVDPGKKLSFFRRYLSNWIPQVPVLLCPSWETLPQDAQTPIRIWWDPAKWLLQKLLQEEKCLVISPLLGALQCTLAPEEWLDQILVLEKDGEAPLDRAQRPVAMGSKE